MYHLLKCSQGLLKSQGFCCVVKTDPDIVKQGDTIYRYLTQRHQDTLPLEKKKHFMSI